MMLYKAVYLPRILYGANTWYPSIRGNNKIKRKLESAQRRALLAVTGAYSTVSTMALQVIAGAPPFNLQIEMHLQVQNGIPPKKARTRCIKTWQNKWNESTKGRWTNTVYRQFGAVISARDN